MNQGSRRESLEKRLEALTEEYSALSAAIENETNPATKTKQKRCLKAVESEMDEIEGKLEGLDSRRRLLELQSKLPEIDFELLAETIQKILKDHGEGGCAALLLFQKSAKMGGEWCAARIRELLRRKTHPGQFRHIPVAFQPTERVEVMTLLRCLGQHLGIDDPAGRELRSFSEHVVQTLCGSLQNGSIVLIECHKCDYFLNETDIFYWIVEDFWGAMVRELAAIAKTYYGVKVIALLFVDDILPAGCFAVDQRCTFEHFQKDRLLEIPLEPWTCEDIKDWIVQYSGLSLLGYQIDLMANKIYRSTLEGLPGLVVHELLKECCPITAR